MPTALIEPGITLTILTIPYTIVSRILASLNITSTVRAIPIIRHPTIMPLAPFSEFPCNSARTVTADKSAYYTHKYEQILTFLQSTSPSLERPYISIPKPSCHNNKNCNLSYRNCCLLHCQMCTPGLQEFHILRFFQDVAATFLA